MRLECINNECPFWLMNDLCADKARRYCETRIIPASEARAEVDGVGVRSNELLEVAERPETICEECGQRAIGGSAASSNEKQ